MQQINCTKNGMNEILGELAHWWSFQETHTQAEIEDETWGLDQSRSTAEMIEGLLKICPWLQTYQIPTY